MSVIRTLSPPPYRHTAVPHSGSGRSPARCRTDNPDPVSISSVSALTFCGIASAGRLLAPAARSLPASSARRGAARGQRAASHAQRRPQRRAGDRMAERLWHQACAPENPGRRHRRSGSGLSVPGAHEAAHAAHAPDGAHQSVTPLAIPAGPHPAASGRTRHGDPAGTGAGPVAARRCADSAAGAGACFAHELHSCHKRKTPQQRGGSRKGRATQGPWVRLHRPASAATQGRRRSRGGATEAGQPPRGTFTPCADRR